jgi:hypothetical protein
VAHSKFVLGMRVLLFVFLLVSIAARCSGQPLNVRISDPQLRDPEEVSIALNPQNLAQLAVGANIRYLFRSSDSGMTWDFSWMSSNYGFWGDPCLMYDDSGVLYYEHLSGQNWQDPEFLWRIVVQRSTDAGGTFDGGEQIGLAPPTMQDKAWLSLDRSNTRSRGALYTSWTEFDRYGSRDFAHDSSRIFFSRSSDRGISWSDRVRVDDTGGDCLDSSHTVEGATTTVNKYGDVFVAWSAHDNIYLDRSSDGGKTFGRDIILAEQPRGWDFDVHGTNRSNGFGMLASDLNPKSRYYGRMYFMWSDQMRGVTDVWLSYSIDDGATWTPRKRVNGDESLKHHFFPSMAVDPVTGRLYIVYYDRRNYDDDRTDVYLSRSIDGGQSFIDERISTSVFKPVDSVFFGDYIHIAAYDRHVYPVWMREDFLPQPALSVWTAPIFDTAPSFQYFASQNALRAVNALRPSLQIDLWTYQSISLELFDMLGRKVATLLSGDYGAGAYRIQLPPGVAAGAYVARLTGSGPTVTAKVTVL